jgi:hypothetical protein
MTRDSGLDRPDKPGVWERKEGDWLLLTEYVRGLFRVVGFQGTERYRRTIDCPVHILPRGGWLPATPAPDLEGASEALARRFSIVDSQGAFKDEEVAAELRKHFRSPALEGELPMVGGRQVKIVACGNGFAIVENELHSKAYLRADGFWDQFRGKYHQWDTREAAAAFLAQHADQPAAVSPAAPAEQGDELTALRQLNIDHCADEERIKELAQPILGEKRVNGEGYFVNSLQVVEMLVEQLAALKAAKGQ